MKRKILKKRSVMAHSLALPQHRQRKIKNKKAYTRKAKHAKPEGQLNILSRVSYDTKNS